MVSNTSPSECTDRADLFAATLPKQRLAKPELAAKTMSIFEIDQALCLLLEAAEEAADQNAGQIPDELRTALLDYCEAFGEKVDNIARYIRFQEFEAANAAAEIERLDDRKAAAEHRIERIKDLLKFFMTSRGMTTMKGRINTIALRKNSQDSLVVDPVKLPAGYWRVTIALSLAEWQDIIGHLPEDHALRARYSNANALKRDPDNVRIRSALAGGMPVEGAELRRGTHVRLT